MLTDEQIKNWRKLLFLELGFHAWFISRENIEKFVKELQTKIDKESEKFDGKSSENNDM